MLQTTMQGRHFDKGDKVEVLRGDDSSLWFPGKVIRSSRAMYKDQIYVEYETLKSGKKKAKRLREYVAAASIRPSPPLELHRYFKAGETVDAFHENAWRRGTVVDILENSRYLVSFDGLDDKFEFEQWHLRLHREWDDGSWFPPFPEKREAAELQIKPGGMKLRIKCSGITMGENFHVGLMVEVRSEKEDRRDSWYTAVIVDSVGTDKFLVEYQTLRADGGTELLKEYVDSSCVRPCPPEIPQIDYYKQFQEVDVWHNDGWWVGLIFEVLDGLKYVVHILSMNEEMTVEHSKLRPHQDWIGGKWIAASEGSSGPELKSRERKVKLRIKCGGKTSDPEFGVGTKVEVRSDEEGYQGSWYSAAIVGSLGNDKFLVEYQTLKTDDETELLKEKTDASYIRPCPPNIQRLDRFKLFERVDAWYNDGWWVGLISRVLDGLSYTVYFWTTNEELEFGHFNLRPHQEWIGGKWIADFRKKLPMLLLKPRPRKLTRQNSLITLEANQFSRGMKIEVESDEEGCSSSWYPAVVLGVKGTGKYLVEYRTLKADIGIELLKEQAHASCIRPCPPVIQRIDPFEPFEEVDAWYNNAWWVGFFKILQGSKYAVHIKVRGTIKVLEFQHSDLRPYQEWTDGKWVISHRGRKL